MKAEHVKCHECDATMYVIPGTDVCPRCGVSGNLLFVNELRREVDVPESKITK